jgi:ATP phosphoribosyltransferase
MKRLKIAIQKSGRLNEDSLQLLKECGVKINSSSDALRASASGFPLDIFFLRNGDIPNYLEDDVVDIAILGENTLLESGTTYSIDHKLGFSSCRLSIATPKEVKNFKLTDLNGKKIATSYPTILENFLKKEGVKADIHTISGSVEIAPNIGLADAICDIVSSGATLFQNGLVEQNIVLQSEAVMVSSPKIDEEARQLYNELLFRITSVLQARNFKYILLNAPNEKIPEISKILPVLKSPTVLPLAMEGWSSIHSVIEKDKFWEILAQLKAVGAEGILVVPIEKMVV